MTQYNPFVEQRRLYLQRLAKIFEINPDIDEEEIIARFCIGTGLKRETVRAMVQELKDAGYIKDGRKCDFETSVKKSNKKTKPARK